MQIPQTGGPVDKFSGPYATAAYTYWDAGWHGVLPLPPQAKADPPDGYTGHDGKWPTKAQVARWVEQDENRNIGVRLPDGVIGLDVDDYGGKRGGETFAALRTKYDLPTTYSLSSRDDDVSGIYLFRVPEGLSWPGKLGPGIDVIQHTHRYYVAPPSIHPEGRRYWWFSPDGVPLDVGVPELAELADLPQGLVADVAQMARDGAGAATPRAVRDFKAQHTSEAYPDAYENLIQRFRNKTDEGESRHDSMTAMVRRICEESAAGAYPADEALQAARQAWRSIIKSDPERAKDHRAEFQRAVSWGVASANAKSPDELAEILDELEPRAPKKKRAAKLRVLQRNELKRIPTPEPLIADWLDLRTAGVLAGPQSANKSFTFIGMACAIATGTEWLGYPVQIAASPVSYVVGEGISGLNNRIAAWEMNAGVDVPNEMLLTYPLPELSMREEEFWELLTEDAKARGDRAVFLETFSSLAPEADETKDAAWTIRKLTALSLAIDGVAMLGHHTGWGSQDRVRGGSQFERNSDFVLISKLHEDGVTALWQKKVKDGPSDRTIYLQRIEIGESCVLEKITTPETVATKGTDWSVDIQDLIIAEPGKYRSMTHVLSELQAAGGKRFAKARPAWYELVDSNLIVKRDGRYFPGDGHI
jgi:Bifunctional DNA primase/polymerase, N-terminal/AAA domain